MTIHSWSLSFARKKLSKLQAALEHRVSLLSLTESAMNYAHCHVFLLAALSCSPYCSLFVASLDPSIHPSILHPPSLKRSILQSPSHSDALSSGFCCVFASSYKQYVSVKPFTHSLLPHPHSSSFPQAFLSK